MGRITYADKVALNSNAGIPAQNKVNDVDMNNVKNAINQLGAYLSATVQTGQPGKCYITAPGTLASGDTFNVILPTAVNPSANAQFSVDGGTTYYPIVENNNIQLKVLNVAQKKCTLVFNGTNFINLFLPTDILTGKLGSNMTTVQATYTVIPVAEISKVGTKLTISSGKILIGAGISKVIISAFIQYQRPNATIFVFKTQRVRSGVTTDIGISAYSVTGAENTVIVPIATYSVQEGDLIQLIYNDLNASGNSIRADGTFMTVQVVE